MRLASHRSKIEGLEIESKVEKSQTERENKIEKVERMMRRQLKTRIRRKTLPHHLPPEAMPISDPWTRQKVVPRRVHRSRCRGNRAPLAVASPCEGQTFDEQVLPPQRKKGERQSHVWGDRVVDEVEVALRKRGKQSFLHRLGAEKRTRQLRNEAARERSQGTSPGFNQPMITSPDSHARNVARSSA